MYLKKYINKKTIISFIVVMLLLSLSGGYYRINAQSDTNKKVSIVSKDNNGDDKIFSDKDGFWYPGRTLEKKFAIKNDNDREIEIDKLSANIISVNNFVLNKIINPDEDIYKKFLQYLKVQLKDGDNVLFDGTFEEFADNEAILKQPIKIEKNSEKEFSITLHVEEKMGNIFQDLRNLFNLSIQYILDDGTAVNSNITDLPKTGTVYNFIVLFAGGLLIAGIGFMVIGYKEENSLKKGGSKGAE